VRRHWILLEIIGTAIVQMQVGLHENLVVLLLWEELHDLGLEASESDLLLGVLRDDKDVEVVGGEPVLMVD
jgi:hypothetical protein